MRIRDLKFNGIRSFTQEAKINFGRDPGLYFLCGQNDIEPELGSNGVGKSTVWSALCWILYGKTPEGLRAGTLKSWQLEKGGYSGSVTIGKHKIKRRWKPNKLTLDGKIVTQDTIDQILCMNFDIFLCAVLMAQSGRTFLDLPAATKMDLFSDVLQLERWESYSREAGRMVSMLDGHLLSSEKQYSKLEGRLEGLDVEDLEDRAKSWGLLKKEELKKVAFELRESKRIRSRYLTLRNKSQKGLDKIKGEVNELSQKLEQLEESKKECKTELYGFRFKIALFDGKIKTGLEKSNNLEGIDRECPLCEQTVNREQVVEILSLIKSELRKFSSKRKALNMRVKKTTNKLKRLEEEFSRTDKNIRKAEKEEIVRSSRLHDYEVDAEGQKEIAVGLKRMLDKGKREKNPYKAMVEKSRKKEKALQVSLDKCGKKINKIRERQELNKYWIRGFKDLRLYLIEEALEQLEIETNANLYRLGLQDWQIHFTLVRKTKSGGLSSGFNVMVQSPYNHEQIPFEAWSGGERQRLRIAGTMGFMSLVSARAGLKFNLEVYDEPTQGLSPEGIDCLLQSLQARAEELKKCIWLVDHHSLQFGGFKQIMTVRKTAQGSVIER